MVLSRPILSITIAPADSNDRERLHAALTKFIQSDPALAFSVDPASSITNVRGESLAQLEAVCSRLEDEAHVHLAFASVEVIRLETIRQPAEAEGKYIRQTGGSGNYAHVKLRLEPGERGKGIEFFDEIRGGVIPPHFIQPIEAGIREAAQGGILAGYEMADLRATLYGGSFHETDSNNIAFRIAASQAFQEAARKALPIVLEPVMSVVLRAPELNVEAMMAEISRRRGRVVSDTHIRGIAIVQASIPLAEMFRDMDPAPTTMVFESFEPAPPARDDPEPAGSTVRNPWRPKPRIGSAAVDLEADSDWT